MSAALTLSGIISIALPIIIIIVVLFVLFKVGKALLKYIFGIIANSILGFIAILLLDHFFALGIVITLPIIIATALFGLPAVGTMVILKVLGGVAV